jgi:hypothetical protein
MKSQITNRNTDRIRFLCGMNSNAWRSLAIAVLLLLVPVSYASAQGGTTCSDPPGIADLCPSPQYRSGASGTSQFSSYNANLTGSPLGDAHILNPTTIGQLVLKSMKPAPGHGGCVDFTFPGVSKPTTSPSTASRIMFPALDANPNHNCALLAYDIHQNGLGWWTELPGTVGGGDVVSSPGYEGGYIHVADEFGNLYAFGYVTGQLAWTFVDPVGGFDSSPTTWPNLDGVYIIDNVGVIYKVDQFLGTQIYAIDSGVYAGGVAFDGSYSAASASSVSVSSSAPSALFVAGSPTTGGTTGIVNAYHSDTGNPYWTNTTSLPNAATSSPVVSDSEGLVYVQSTVACPFVINPHFSGALLYALDRQTGAEKWKVSPNDPQLALYGGCPFAWGLSPALPGLDLSPVPTCHNVYSSGGSPAYDEPNKYVIASAIVNCVTSFSNGTSFIFFGYSILNVFRGGSSLPSDPRVCQTQIKNPVTGNPSKVTYSSPEVVSGIVYIGTDDGYIQAYDETTCAPLWHSDLMDSPMLSPPVVSFNRVHAVSQNGTLYVWAIPGH